MVELLLLSIMRPSPWLNSTSIIDKGLSTPLLQARAEDGSAPAPAEAIRLTCVFVCTYNTLIHLCECGTQFHCSSPAIQNDFYQHHHHHHHRKTITTKLFYYYSCCVHQPIQTNTHNAIETITIKRPFDAGLYLQLLRFREYMFVCDAVVKRAATQRSIGPHGRKMKNCD